MSVFDGTLFAFAGLALLVAMTPGPDMATVTRNGLAYGRRGVILTSLGIGTALLCWIAATGFGVAALLATSAVLFTMVQLAGAVSRAYRGVRSLLSSRHQRRSDDPGQPRAAAARRLYRTG